MREIDEALERIEQKTYGACDRCGSAIPTSRLEVLPFTRYCVACQQEREKPGG
jgi:RNA polymerase-binding transcription factor DksA